MKEGNLSIAVVGSGGGGLSAAWALSQRHRVTLYEADPRPGGHANTLTVQAPEGPLSIDTGFIVHNLATYPQLLRLLAALGVATQESNMSFAVSLDGGRREYAGSARGLFAQRSLLASPRHWRMTRDLLRFLREAREQRDTLPPDLSLGDWLARENYSAAFLEDHLLPMAAAIWSCPPATMLSYPAASFLSFCANHGLLQQKNRPQWRSITGGSASYVQALLRQFRGQLRLNCKVMGVEPQPQGVMVTDSQGDARRFDHVVLACHSDQALQTLGPFASPIERAALSAITYRPNTAWLHSDPRLMPRRRRVWSSWNYLAGKGDQALSVTYWMNRLQALQSCQDYFVSLNPPFEPAPALTQARIAYAHPCFDQAALTGQQLLPAIQGRRGLWYCGAWCGHGFHEDAVQAGLTVAAALGAAPDWWGEVTPASPAARTAAALAFQVAAA